MLRRAPRKISFRNRIWENIFTSSHRFLKGLSSSFDIFFRLGLRDKAHCSFNSQTFFPSSTSRQVNRFVCLVLFSDFAWFFCWMRYSTCCIDFSIRKDCWLIWSSRSRGLYIVVQKYPIICRKAWSTTIIYLVRDLIDKVSWLTGTRRADLVHSIRPDGLAVPEYAWMPPDTSKLFLMKCRKYLS